MPGMDIFNDNAFSLTSLSGYVQKMDYKPQLLGSLGIFEPDQVRTRNVFIDRSDENLTLIPASEDGAPPAVLGKSNRDAVPAKTTRLAKEFKLYAHELDGIRASGTESDLEAVQAEFDKRMRRLRNDMELTHEHHRLGALQGLVLDADGSTVLYDFSTMFEEVIPAATSFELDDPNTEVRLICNQITRSMARSSRGAFNSSTRIHAIAGDDFYDSFIKHQSVEKTYLNWAAAADLRQGGVYDAFTFANITIHNFRGTDDNSTVAIPTTEAKFFPVGATDVFKHVMSPMSDSLEFVNTLGEDVYSMIVRDKDRDFWVNGELYSYPMMLCQQPRVLRKGTLT